MMSTVAAVQSNQTNHGSGDISQTGKTPKNFMKMLNYFKTILSRVSFDARLFEKELRKAIKALIAEELQELKNWCYANFGNEHGSILNRCFVVS